MPKPIGIRISTLRIYLYPVVRRLHRAGLTADMVTIWGFLFSAGAAIAIEPYANSGSRYYAENFAAACDSPGEWYHDLAASILLWQPRHAAEDPHGLEFVAPIVAGDLLLLDGKPPQSRGHLGCILPRVPAT